LIRDAASGGIDMSESSEQSSSPSLPQSQSQQQPRLPLNVLPHSGKVDQLREELKAKPLDQKPLAHQSIVDRAIDQRHSSQQKAIVEKVIDAARTVFDPEIPVNIYELGLIYDIAVDENNSVHVKMTLTAPGCPVAGTLPVEVEKKIAGIDGVSAAKVELVWEPAWTKERMSEVALLELGLG
jgi:FeS assembly SUF system protein